MTELLEIIRSMPSEMALLFGIVVGFFVGVILG